MLVIVNLGGQKADRRCKGGVKSFACGCACHPGLIIHNHGYPILTYGYDDLMVSGKIWDGMGWDIGLPCHTMGWDGIKLGKPVS